MAEHADKRLAARLLAGNRGAFDAYFNTYFPRLYRFAAVRLDGDGDLAEEAAQVTLCKALSKLHTYRGEAALFSWLCTFCRHEIAAQRRQQRRARGDTPLVEEDPAVRAALESLTTAALYDPQAALTQGELMRLVQVALDQLPSLYGDALEYKYVHGLSVREIAERVGKSAKAVESTLTRARDAFREAFTTLVRVESDRDEPITSEF